VSGALVNHHTAGSEAQRAIAVKAHVLLLYWIVPVARDLRDIEGALEGLVAAVARSRFAFVVPLEVVRNILDNLLVARVGDASVCAE